MTVKLSVVMPFYNVSAYLAEAIDSVLRQDVALELILVDDGSTDNSHAIAARYADQYAQVYLYRFANQGLGQARNEGILKAHGEYLTFVDSDDVIVDGAYAKLLAQIDASQSDFIAGNIARWRDQQLYYSTLHEHAFPATVSGVTIADHHELLCDTTVWNKIYRRSFWDARGLQFPDGGVLFEDIPVTQRLYVGATVDVNADLMYLWRSRSAGDASITQTQDQRNFDDRLVAVCDIRDYFVTAAPDLVVDYQRKVCTNDFQIYLKTVLRQPQPLVVHMLTVLENYFASVAWAILATLPLDLRIQYTLLKQKKRDQLMAYLREQTAGDVVTVAVATKTGVQVANRYSAVLPPELRFMPQDTQGTANLVSVQQQGRDYQLDIRQEHPFITVGAVKLAARYREQQRALGLQATSTRLKRWLVGLFAADELGRITVLEAQPGRGKRWLAHGLRRLIGDQRYRDLRKTAQKTVLPALVRVPVATVQADGVQVMSTLGKQPLAVSDVHALGYRPALMTMPTVLADQRAVQTSLDAQWRFLQTPTTQQVLSPLKQKTPATRQATVVQAGSTYQLVIADCDDADDRLELEAANDTRVVYSTVTGTFTLPTDATEQQYQLYLRSAKTDTRAPVMLVAAENASFEQTLTSKTRVIQLQQPLFATTAVFRQWTPFQWYEATALRRQAFRALIYPLLRRLPLRPVMMHGAFWGRNFSDSPRALADYALTHFPQYRQVALLNHNLGQYDLPQVTFVKPGSFKSYYYFARARYLFNNVNFEDHFVKRSQQVEVQTMHGTPLKKIGLDAPNEVRDDQRAAYLRRNNRWDYLTVPSDYVAGVAQSAFQHHAQVLPTGYPRNDALFARNDSATITALKQQLALPCDRRIILYAPTWRTKGDFTPQLDFTVLRQQLTTDSFIILKLHQFMTMAPLPADLRDFVRVIGNETDITDLYLVSDVLITDYSSVMFDYGVLRRPIVFYAYDYAKYSQDMRPLYFDFKADAPGPFVTSQVALLAALNTLATYDHTYADQIAHFRKKFIQYDRGGACAAVFRHIGLSASSGSDTHARDAQKGKEVL